MYISKLSELTKEYTGTTRRTTKMKHFDVKPDIDVNMILRLAQKPKFNVGDHVRISKYQIIFARGYQTI